MTEEACEPPRSHGRVAEFRRQGFKSGFQPGFTIKQVDNADVFFPGAAVCGVPVQGSYVGFLCGVPVQPRTHTPPLQRPELCRDCPEFPDPSSLTCRV